MHDGFTWLLQQVNWLILLFTLKRSQKKENLVSKPSSLKLSINRVSLNCQSTFEFLLLVFVEGSL